MALFGAQFINVISQIIRCRPPEFVTKLSQELNASAAVGPVSYTHLDVYKRQVREAMNPPVQEARTLRDQITPETAPDQERAAEDDRLAQDLEKGNQRIRELLQQQTEAGNRATKGARLKQQVETLQRQVAELEQDLGAKPEDYQPEACLLYTSRCV